MGYIGNKPKEYSMAADTQYFSGDGVTTDFPLKRAIASVNDIDVVINNVPQNPKLVYSIIANQLLRISSAPSVGTDNVYVKFKTLTVGSYSPTPGSVNLQSLDTTLQTSIFASARNRIINPFTENQRGLTSVGDDVYCLDRWYVLTETGNVTIAQVMDPESGAPAAIRLTQPDASAKRMGLATIIESKDIRPYRNMSMNFAARVKTNNGGNVRYAIIEHTGTTDVVTSDVVNSWTNTTFTPGNFFIAGINVLKTGIVTPTTSVYGDLSDWSVLGAATNNVVLFVWTESAVAQNVTLELNRPQYEPGTIRTPQEWRPNELALCQRYYEVLVLNNNASSLLSSVFVNTNNWTTWYFKQQKRATPSVALTSTGAWVNLTPTIYPTTTQADCQNTSGYFYLGGTAWLPSIYASSEL